MIIVNFQFEIIIVSKHYVGAKIALLWLYYLNKFHRCSLLADTEKSADLA